MAIVLVTGLPGHGKTLYSLVRWKEEAERDGRQVFHNGIKGLKLDWLEHDPLKWFELPASSIMVIDEAQKVFRIRPRSSEVPPHVSELETHRHGGLDLVLITQHPTLVDPHVRKLVDRHFHVVRAFGTHNTTVYEFPTGAQDYPDKSRRKPGVIQHQWRYPKAAFEWYQSAEVHTVKRRLPAKVWVFLALVVVTPMLLFAVWWRLHAQAQGGGASAGHASVPASGVPASAVVGVAPSVHRFKVGTEAGRDLEAYLAPYQPRVAGMAFTAPVYDAMTKPAEAPYPAVCAFAADFPCRCWSQRGFALVVPAQLCQTLAKEPMDPYWRHRTAVGLERPGMATGFSAAPASASAPAFAAPVDAAASAPGGQVAPSA